MPLTNISDTARWVAMYRAIESDRSDAVFRDPFARRLAGARGEEILNAMPKGRRYGWPMVVRTALFDELILRAVERDGVDTVINLAAGLDARPYRLPLPPALRWIDVDLPPMIDYKRAVLSGDQAVCTLESVGLDLADRRARRALLERLERESKQALVVTEGLLIYLERQQVAELAADLHDQSSLRWWAIDIVAPWLLQMMTKTWGRQLDAAAAPLKFAPEEGVAFYAQRGWRPAEERATFDEAKRLRRLPWIAPLWKLMSVFTPKKIREQQSQLSGVVLLERT